MPGIPTEHIVDDLKDLRESHRQLAGEVHELRGELAGFRVEVARDLGAVRTEMATVNGTLERLEGRLDHSLSVAKWTIGILAPAILGLIGSAFWLTWHAAKLDSRVERVENAVGAAQKPAAVRR
jgi:hypothetical protein